MKNPEILDLDFLPKSKKHLIKSLTISGVGKMKPKHLNEKATKIMDCLTEGLTEDSSHKKIGEPNSAFMQVSIEFLCNLEVGELYTVAHYYEQNGDLMSDPRMEFIKNNGKYFPSYFRQDGFPGADEESIYPDETGKMKVLPSTQNKHTVFANQWMLNIKNQQKLDC